MILSEGGGDIMPEIEAIEREYRELSARLAYAFFESIEVSDADLKRLEELSECRVKLTAPNFAALIREAA